MRKAPTIILSIILIVAIAAAGLWFAASMATEKALQAWFEDRHDEGWTATYSGLNTAGFPNRLDTSITDLTLVDPDTGVGWQAPIVQTLALVYKPTHVIAILPGRQSFSAWGETHEITSDVFRASLVLLPSPSLPIERSTLETENAQIRSAKGAEIGLRKAVLSMRQTPEAAGDVYDIHVTAGGLRPDDDLLARLNRSGRFSEVLDEILIRATVTFDAPWDRYALERARPQPREITLTEVSAKWGRLEFSAKGRVMVNRSGIPDGEIAIKARNWRDMITVARETGALPEALVGAVTRAGTIIADMSGSPETLDATLRYERGRAFLGPIPLGAAPQIRLP